MDTPTQPAGIDRFNRQPRILSHALRSARFSTCATLRSYVFYKRIEIETTCLRLYNNISAQVTNARKVTPACLGSQDESFEGGRACCSAPPRVSPLQRKQIREEIGHLFGCEAVEDSFGHQAAAEVLRLPN